MPTFKRLFLSLMILSFLLVGCTPAPTPTSETIPATLTPVPATLTPVPPTNTPVPPTVTAEPTAIPTPEIPHILQDKTYHKTSGDMGEDVLIADDGGFYIVGTSDLDLTGAGASGDIYLIRTDANGETLWEKNFGGEKADEGLSIIRTKDGNLLTAGTTKSSGAGGSDAYLIKIDLDGNEIWSKTFGSTLDESASVRELADGSFMLWGNVVDPNDVVADPGAAGYIGYGGRSNIYLAKVDSAGNQLWTKTLGDQNNLLTSGGVETPDGGFLVLASLLRFPNPGDDLYLIKVDQNGTLVWERIWEDGTTQAFDLIRTRDDHFLIAASYLPENSTAQTKADFFFIKVDLQGEEVWTSHFGDPDMMDYPMVVTQSADGGYIAVGDSVKDFSGRYPGSISVTRLDQDGNMVWLKTIKPNSGHNILRALVQLADGSCLLAGSKLVGQQFDIFLMTVDMGVNGSAYLGQTPPGLTPQVFAPGIVSISSAVDYGITFSVDGTELYFTRRMNDTTRQNIYEMHLTDGVWSDPAPVAFSAEFDAHEPHLTADNKVLYFGWFRPPPEGVKSTMDAGIWAVDRTENGWSAPRYVGEGMFVSSEQNGQIYVTNFSAGGTPRLSQATLTDGRFTNWKVIADGVHPAIAPDGSYLVFDDGNGNLRVRFNSGNGKWGQTIDLTKHGIPATASISSISRDGKYMFYTYEQDIYWVSTEIITSLK